MDLLQPVVARRAMVMTSQYARLSVIGQALRRGLGGYLLKTDPIPMQLGLMQQFCTDRPQFSLALDPLLEVLEADTEQEGVGARPSGRGRLSATERKLLLFLARGQTLTSAAQTLRVKRCTARTLWSRARTKLWRVAMRVCGQGLEVVP